MEMSIETLKNSLSNKEFNARNYIFKCTGKGIKDAQEEVEVFKKMVEECEEFPDYLKEALLADVQRPCHAKMQSARIRYMQMVSSMLSREESSNTIRVAEPTPERTKRAYHRKTAEEIQQAVIDKQNKAKARAEAKAAREQAKAAEAEAKAEAREQRKARAEEKAAKAEEKANAKKAISDAKANIEKVKAEAKIQKRKVLDNMLHAYALVCDSYNLRTWHAYQPIEDQQLVSYQTLLKAWNESDKAVLKHEASKYFEEEAKKAKEESDKIAAEKRKKEFEERQAQIKLEQEVFDAEKKLREDRLAMEQKEEDQRRAIEAQRNEDKLAFERKEAEMVADVQAKAMTKALKTAGILDIINLNSDVLAYAHETRDKVANDIQPAIARQENQIRVIKAFIVEIMKQLDIKFPTKLETGDTIHYKDPTIKTV